MYLILFISFLAGVGGLYLGIIGFKNYQNISMTAEKVSVMQIIKIASSFGVASTLVFFAFIVSTSAFDEKYVWSLQKFGGAILVALIPGLLTTLGGIYQVYTTVIFRDQWIKKYNETSKRES
jgi:hypothetical protein